ncbi:hypothetical protein QTO34_000446 [Cnephaeus nilssonii]|uniref:Uncharacterized protein n=1 Tax=Cnephaeus nilssonii TaxID=3371016 RepID=A0AA40LWW9_CNENI|nr:hypothetical protein QTO34_000446 [Eptesicus nilssonii]
MWGITMEMIVVVAEEAMIRAATEAEVESSKGGRVVGTEVALAQASLALGDQSHLGIPAQGPNLSQRLAALAGGGAPRWETAGGPCPGPKPQTEACGIGWGQSGAIRASWGSCPEPKPWPEACSVGCWGGAWQSEPGNRSQLGSPEGNRSQLGFPAQSPSLCQRLAALALDGAGR